MMQATDLRDRDHRVALSRFDLSFDGRVAIQRQVSPRFMVVREVRLKDSSQMSVVQLNRVILTLAADRTDQAFDIWFAHQRAVR